MEHHDAQSIAPLGPDYLANPAGRVFDDIGGGDLGGGDADFFDSQSSGHRRCHRYRHHRQWFLAMAGGCDSRGHQRAVVVD